MNTLSRGSTALMLIMLALTSTQAADPKAQVANRIIEQRCLVCHGCYDAPCQLKMEAHEGLRRGATKAKVYEASRLREAPLTRLFDDAQTEQAWREMGFYPVLDDEQPGRGLVKRMLDLKREHPLPTQGPMPEGFDFALDRKEQCPKPEEFSRYKKRYPLWGMPYGLPGLNEDEHQAMIDWIMAGASAVPLAQADAELAAQVDNWERFLNGGSHKERLMARYIYEHLFIGSLYLLDAQGEPAWYRLVRSASPPGEPLELIATRRPFDAPGVDRVHYRLQAMQTTPLRKIHMPYRFDAARMSRYEELFISPDYAVDELPDYSTSNPFSVFHAIPERSRYRFMLDEAQFTVMNYIKGPVCRGRVALNVIEDRFWVMFVDPDGGTPHDDKLFLAEEAVNLALPEARRGTVIDLVDWRRYSKAQERYQVAKWEHIERIMNERGDEFGYDVLWDGDGSNDNAALTIFRHFDTASVVKGFVGDIPKTAWVIDYPMLERIHYLLVAGFDVYGSLSHQLESRLYMDFLRMEGELNFLMFMPAEKRREMHDFWYRDARESVKTHLFDLNVVIEREPAIVYESEDPKREFLETVSDMLPGARAHRYRYRERVSDDIAQAFARLEAAQGEHNSFLPQVNYINIIGRDRDQVFTLLRNSGYSNIAQLFKEEKRRLPDEDRLTVVSGFIGAYPNRFFQINEQDITAFADDLLAMESLQDYAALVERFGVQRNSPFFWRISDKLHAVLKAQEPVAWGILDLNRYEGYLQPQP
ncbi:MAG: fatty acid cis/trans isomerase [Pseudomonadota bacterium]